MHDSHWYAPLRTLCLVIGIGPAACHEDDPGLSREDVTDIEPGNAQGSAHSGRYDAEAYTASCEGACGPIDYQGFSYVICDVGDRTEGEFEVTQDGGELRVDLDGDGLYITRFRGGIDSDGSFEVGGYGTELGGSIEINGLVEGTIDDDGTLEAIADYHLHGRVEGDLVDCRVTYETEGRRAGDADD